MKTLKISFLIFSISLSGCSIIKIGEPDPMQVVTNKATFIFDCPKESLSISCINEMGLIFKDCIEYGVNGCGKKSVYSKIGNSWVMTDSK